MFFAESFAQLRDAAPQLLERGVRVACVVQAHARDLRSVCPGAATSHGGTVGRPGLLCIPDPGRESHRALGLARMSPWKLLTSAELWRRRAQARSGGFRQDWKRTFRRESDGLRLPGAALIARGGRILWLYRGDHLADLPSAEALVAIAGEFATSVRL